MVAKPLELGKSRIALVRHGSYRLSTGALDALGEQQARNIVQKLQASMPWRAVYHSPILRTQETAHIIARALHIPCLEDTRLHTDTPTKNAFIPAWENAILVTHAPIIRACLRYYNKTHVQEYEPYLAVGEYVILEDGVITT